MLKKAKPVLKVFAVLIGAVLIFAVGLIGWLTVTEYKPDKIQNTPIFTTDFWVPGILEESDLPEGWQYVYDDSVPTCRLLDKPYDEKSSQRYVIDGFIISPNVELVLAETIDCGFEFSDHNPVLMEIILK